MNKSAIIPRPFLKWAGGKGQLLDALLARIAMAGAFSRYHEPFVGGGALFFELARRKALPRKKTFLSDTNPALINVYEAVRNDAERVIRLLEEHTRAHSKKHYYAVRAKVPEDLVERAARVIYLNKTCFNGLYRENSRGEFNVPIGSYKKPVICDAENLRAASLALGRARIEARHFRTVLDCAEPGDFVYFDPPYHPVSKTSSFAAYAKGGFGEADQIELADLYAALTRRGVKALLSNSWTPLVEDLYGGLAPLGVTLESVSARRHINSRADRRGAVAEALVRNF